MENKEKKLGYGVAWKFNLRAWGIWQKLCPQVFVSLLLSSVVKAVTPYVTIFLSARIIDELSGARRPDQLLRWVVLTLACTAVCALLQGVLTRWSNYAKGCAGQLDDQLYMDKMVALDYADVDRQAVFDLYAQIRQNENWSGWGLPKAISFFEFFVTAVVQILGGVGLSVSLFLSPVPAGSGLAFLNHPLSAVVILGLMLLAAVVSPLCANRANRYWTDHAATVRLANRILSFYPLLGMQRSRAADVRIYKQHENVCEPYLEQNDNFAPGSRLSRIARGPMGLLNALSQCVSVALTALVYVFVCLKAWAGAFGVGYITQYVGAITQLFRGLSALLETMGQIRANGTFLELNFEYLDLPNRMYQGSLTTEKRADRKYEVEFRDVSFRYPGSERWALRHVNIQFRVGSRLAVVGVNGSGKTTFIKLLCRLYDPTEGEILLNGIDIRKYRYEDYMELFSVVFQDFKLLALPLGENVAGASVYDRALARRCLEDAGFGERLAAMPQGLDTSLYRELDPQGVEISGGEAQKIAIARALFKDAPFIVLDEPTAALDPVAEAEIYSKFDAIAGDKTAIYISHRLSSCKFCDEIAVFDHGSIVQQGTHAALLTEKDGVYHALWHAQAQYYTT